MTIQYANKEHVEEIISLCREHSHYENTEYDSFNKAQDLASYIFRPDSVIKCLVVINEQKVVGYVTFMKQFSTWDADWYVYLDCLFLKEKIRGLGIGRQLMDKIKAYAKDEKCKLIQWQTPSFNKNAISFYENLGAEHKTKERFFWSV